MDLSRHTNLSDEDLDVLIGGIKSSTPEGIGIGMLEGHLRARGIWLPNSRVRIWESLRRLDPIQTQLRWNTITQRRQYSVRGKSQFVLF